MYSIERKALNHWEALFEDCERIETRFESHSALPVLDGQIFIWKTRRHANEDLVGRVEAQVKGRSVPKIRPYVYLRRKDLLAMQQSGGVLLLVVQFLESNESKRAAYYRMLFEPEIDEILRSTSKNSSEVRVSLLEAPESSEKLHGMVELAARRAKQGIPIELPDSLMENGFRMTFEVVDELDFNQPVQIGPNGAPASILGTLENGAQLPIKGNYVIVPEHFFPQKSSTTIASETVAFKNCLIQLVPPKDTRIFPSPGLLIQIPADGSDFRLTNRCSGRLSDVVKELRFSSEVLKSGFIEINGEQRRISPSDDLERALLERAAFFRDFEKMVRQLGGDPALITVSEIEARSWRPIEYLIRRVVYGESIPWNFLEAERSMVSFGPMQMQLLFEPPSKEVSVYSLTDPNLEWAETDGKDSHFVIGYELLTQEELNVCVNLNLDTVVEAFERVGDSQEVLDKARDLTDRLIEAADTLSAARSTRLAAAAELNEWVRAHQSTPSDMLAHWQIKYRRQEITDNDREEILEMMVSAPWSDQHDKHVSQVMCRILLGQIEVARAEYDLLAEDETSFLELNPIFKLLGAPDDFYIEDSRSQDDWEPLIKDLKDEIWQKVATQVANARMFRRSKW